MHVLKESASNAHQENLILPSQKGVYKQKQTKRKYEDNILNIGQTEGTPTMCGVAPFLYWVH